MEEKKNNRMIYQKILYVGCIKKGKKYLSFSFILIYFSFLTLFFCSNFILKFINMLFYPKKKVLYMRINRYKTSI